MRGLLTLLMVLSWVSMVSCQKNVRPADQVEIDTNLIAFTRAVFGNAISGGEHSKVSQPCLAKWDQSIKFSISEQADRDQRGELLKILDNYSKLTGLAINEVDSQSESQLNIAFTHHENINPRNYKGKCSANRRVNPQCVITHATVSLPLQLNRTQLRYCAYHELLHALGFQGHVRNVNSVLNPKLTIQQLTPWDRAALVMIYQQELPVGSSIRKTIQFVKNKK